MSIEIIFIILIGIVTLAYCFFKWDFDLLVNKIFISKLSKRSWSIFNFILILFLIIFIISSCLFRENLKEYFGLYS